MLTCYLITGSPYLMFDAIHEGRHVLVACGVGRVEGDDALLTDTGNATLDAICGYAEKVYGANFTVVFQEIAALHMAKARIRKALKAAHNKSVVFFVCRDPDIYDTAFVALNVRVLGEKPLH